MFDESADMSSSACVGSSESAWPERKLRLLISRDFIILFSHYGGPCFVAQHQHCWGPALRFPPSVRCLRSVLLGSRSATRPKTGRFQRRSACVKRKRKACGCSWRKDKPWPATLKRFSLLWGLQSKNRYHLLSHTIYWCVLSRFVQDYIFFYCLWLGHSQHANRLTWPAALKLSMKEDSHC